MTGRFLYLNGCGRFTFAKNDRACACANVIFKQSIKINKGETQTRIRI